MVTALHFLRVVHRRCICDGYGADMAHHLHRTVCKQAKLNEYCVYYRF